MKVMIIVMTKVSMIMVIMMMVMVVVHGLNSTGEGGGDHYENGGDSNGDH